MLTKRIEFETLATGQREHGTPSASEQTYRSCDAAALVSQHGRLLLDFDREAESLPDAIRSALSDIEDAGLIASEIDLPGSRTR